MTPVPASAAESSWYTLEPATDDFTDLAAEGGKEDSVVFFQEEATNPENGGRGRLAHFSLRIVYDPMRNGLEEVQSASG